MQKKISSNVNPIKGFAAMAVFVWGYEFLFETPRGERILKKVDSVIFPKWLIK